MSKNRLWKDNPHRAARDLEYVGQESKQARSDKQHLSSKSLRSCISSKWYERKQGGQYVKRFLDSCGRMVSPAGNYAGSFLHNFLRKT